MRPLDNLALSTALRRLGVDDGPNADPHALRELETAIADYVAEAVYAYPYYVCPFCGEPTEDG